MKLIFVDESYRRRNGNKKRDLYICYAVIDVHNYAGLKRQWIQIMDNAVWKHEEDIEFKAHKILDTEYGGVDIDTKKKMARYLQDTIAKKNAKVKIFFSKIESVDREEQKTRCLYYEHLGGVRIEDVVVVTRDGNENLTRCSKRFRV